MNTGGVRSSVQVTDLDVVAELLQASTAVNVLTRVIKHPFEVLLPSLGVIVTAPHPSVAVAEPRVASILVGLHPSVTGSYVPVNTGGVRSSVQVTDLDVVAELLQASTAVNVLTRVLKHPFEVMLPSLVVIVTAPHPSVAVAEPSVASILVGLHPSVTGS